MYLDEVDVGLELAEGVGDVELEVVDPAGSSSLEAAALKAESTYDCRAARCASAASCGVRPAVSTAWTRGVTAGCTRGRVEVRNLLLGADWNIAVAVGVVVGLEAVRVLVVAVAADGVDA